MNLSRRKLLEWIWIGAALLPMRGFGEPVEPFEIQVVDAKTGRGVPLVELKTVNHLTFVTDSAGRVAFAEPGLVGQTVFFHVRSHGYEFPKDGFGNAGARLKPVAGGKEVLRIERKNRAERLYRVTGEGIYRDSVLLGYGAPIREPLLNAQVAGQDSVQPVIYGGKIHWFWGDTSRMGYPLGNFRTSGAVSELPGKGGLDPAVGIDLRYFTNAEGFTKEMCPFEPKEGLIWIDGVFTLRDESGRDRLVAHWLRLKTLGVPYEHGIGLYDERNEFERLATFDLEEKRKAPHGIPFKHREGGVDYVYFGISFPTVRVREDWKAVMDPEAYEAWSCLAEGSPADPKQARMNRDGNGRLAYRWTTGAPPTGAEEERKLIEAGLMRAEEAYFQPVDGESGKVVQMHAGTVRWNEWRRKWILIATEIGGSSLLGEVWHAEASAPTGPWKKATKIVTHDRYDFYNPVHHDFLDQEGGRIIYFEGTYVNTFSGNPEETPRYDYNQIMYRLDLQELAGAE